MNKDTMIEAPNPAEGPRDDLTDLLREGAKRLIAQAVDAELSATLAGFADYKDDAGRRYVVRNGYLPEREIMTGIGPVSVRVPKVRDRSGARIKFTYALLPPYIRRARSVEEVLPWLYLKGISTGDMQEALEALLGQDAKDLSPASISRLKARWEGERQVWSQRDLSSKRYVYFWIDGMYFNVRMDEAKQCILVIIGVTEEGVKEFVAIEDGYRESEQSWLMTLRDLKQRGLEIGPELAVGDGALGFWKALPKVYGQTPAARGAGSTRPKTCSTTCPRASSPRPNLLCSRYGWRRAGSKPIKLLIASLRYTKPNIPRPPSAFRRTEMRCWPSMTFLQSIGSTSEPPIQSSLPLPRCV